MDKINHLQKNEYIKIQKKYNILALPTTYVSETLAKNWEKIIAAEMKYFQEK